MYEQNFNPYSANLAVVKGYFKGSKVVILGVLYAVSAVVSIVASLMYSEFLSSYLYEMISFMAKSANLTVNPSLFYSIQSAGGSSNLFSSLAGVALTILVAVAYFIISSKSRSTNPTSSPKAGVTILYVLAMISFIISIIAVSLIALGLVVLTIIYFTVVAPTIDSSYSYIGTIAVIVCLVIAIVAMVLVLMYTTSRKNFYGSVRKSLSSVELQNKGAKTFGGMSIFLVVIYCLSLAIVIASYIFSTNLILQMGETSFSLVFPIPLVAMSVLSMVISILTVGFEGSLSLGYKKYIDNMKYGYSGTPYGGVTGSINTPADNTPNPYAKDAYNDNFGTAPKPAPKQTYTAPKPAYTVSKPTYPQPTSYPRPAQPTNFTEADTFDVAAQPNISAPTVSEENIISNATPATEQTNANPVVTEPINAEPIATEPTNAEPAISEQTSAEPVSSEPVATEPLTSPENSTQSTAEATRFCPMCGNKVSASFPFCPHCGSSLK